MKNGVLSNSALLGKSNIRSKVVFVELFQSTILIAFSSVYGRKTIDSAIIY